MKSAEQLPLLLHAKAAGEILGVGRTKVYRLARAGEIPIVKCGRVGMFPRAGLFAYVDRLMAKSSPQRRG